MKQILLVKVITVSSLFMVINFTGYGQTKWRFAVVGDTHVGSSDTIKEMVPFMIADSIECLLVPGDIVEGGAASSSSQLQTQLTRWQSLLMPLYSKGIGVYPIYGNHENDARNNATAWNNVFTGLYALPQTGPSGEVNFTYSFTHKNALFIGLDDYKSIHKVNQNWLSQQLSSKTTPHIFVFGHEAAFKVFHADCLDDSATARNTFWQSLSNAGVKVYFCGHDHFVDVARIDDGDGNVNNDTYQYLVGTGGGWLMSQYSNYNGTNSSYTPNRIFHEMEFGYALVEMSGDGPSDCNVTITWKKRQWNASTLSNEYVATSNIIQYTISPVTGINAPIVNPFSIYPIPASDVITISGLFGVTKIYNSIGVEMWSKKISVTEIINISAYQNGLYFVRNNKTLNKFVVKR